APKEHRVVLQVAAQRVVGVAVHHQLDGVDPHRVPERVLAVVVPVIVGIITVGAAVFIVGVAGIVVPVSVFISVIVVIVAGVAVEQIQVVVGIALVVVLHVVLVVRGQLGLGDLQR